MDSALTPLFPFLLLDPRRGLCVLCFLVFVFLASSATSCSALASQTATMEEEAMIGMLHLLTIVLVGLDSTLDKEIFYVPGIQGSLFSHHYSILSQINFKTEKCFEQSLLTKIV